MMPVHTTASQAQGRHLMTGLDNFPLIPLRHPQKKLLRATGAIRLGLRVEFVCAFISKALNHELILLGMGIQQTDREKQSPPALGRIVYSCNLRNLEIIPSSASSLYFPSLLLRYFTSIFC